MVESTQNKNNTNIEESKDNESQWNGFIYRLTVNSDVNDELYAALRDLPNSLRAKRLMTLATLGLALSQGDIKNIRKISDIENNSKNKGSRKTIKRNKLVEEKQNEEVSNSESSIIKVVEKVVNEQEKEIKNEVELTQKENIKPKEESKAPETLIKKEIPNDLRNRLMGSLKL